MDDRMEILANSLAIESLTSMVLGFLLDLKEPAKARSLNGTTGLSFNQKIYLLIDIGALNSKDYSTFQYFMQVRNKFMHEFTAFTFYRCYGLLDSSTRNGIKKKYYPLRKDEELKPAEAKAALRKLSAEALELTRSLFEKIKEKAAQKSEEEMLKKFKESTISIIYGITEKLDNYFQELIEKGEDLDPKEFSNFGTNVRTAIIKELFKKMGWSLTPKRKEA